MATIHFIAPGQLPQPPAQQPANPGNSTAQPNVYTPIIRTAESSNLVVLNDNCIISLDAVLSISGIGKVLSHRGHELYTLYSTEGTLCQFEGTGLMQRTVEQIDTLQKQHADRLAELREAKGGIGGMKDTIDRLQRQVDALWYLPGNPGAREAESDFVARKEALDSSTETDDDRPRKRAG